MKDNRISMTSCVVLFDYLTLVLGFGGEKHDFYHFYLIFTNFTLFNPFFATKPSQSIVPEMFFKTAQITELQYGKKSREAMFFFLKW